MKQFIVKVKIMILNSTVYWKWLSYTKTATW